jgi:hypothetical protein
LIGLAFLASGCGVEPEAVLAEADVELSLAGIDADASVMAQQKDVSGNDFLDLSPAVLLVHSDYTVNSGPQRVRDILPAEADGLLQRRVAFYNVWKPLYRRVEELPLAMCDATTHVDSDMLTMELKYRERTGEIYVMRHAPGHRWLYFPLMTPEQALLLKTYDSETDGRARFMGHTAFEHPDTAADAPRRESIEVRTMAFF